MRFRLGKTAKRFGFRSYAGFCIAIEIVGEAASKMSAPTREAAAGIPWSRVVSMRNRLINAYFDVDHQVVWKTATEELPRLLPRLRALVGDAKGEG